jgi:pyroglutamyl-peptidase
MVNKSILLTGFEPYGGRGKNPAYEVVKKLDGKNINDIKIYGYTLPVVNKGLQEWIKEKITTVEPIAIIGLGLWPGETMIRLERVGININDYEIADNEGLLIKNQPIANGYSEALFSTLPLKDIESRLLNEGVPVKISNSAGSFLCNAMLYNALRIIKNGGLSIVCGFIHLPYLPSQVSQIIREMKREQKMELHQRADLASMELSTIIKAIEMAVEITISQLNEQK